MNIENLSNKLQSLKGYFPHAEKSAEKVSAQGIGWHISHSLKVMYLSLKALEESNPKDYKGGFNAGKMMVMTTGYIPRGIAKAPKLVSPEELETGLDFLKEAMQKVQYRVQGLEKSTQEKSFMEHPFFGHLHRSETIKFLAIHTEHHLKIMKDILKKAG